MFSKFHIISEIKRTAKANDGNPLGQGQFESETGIKRSDWRGKYWARWGDALIEAGFSPKIPPDRIEESVILEKLMHLTEKLKRFPTRAEMQLEKRSSKDFPSITIITRRIGQKEHQLKQLLDYSEKRGNSEVAGICTTELSPLSKKSSKIVTTAVSDAEAVIGYVYLIQHGNRKEYKIGKTHNLLRREGEIRLELPEKIRPIHTIQTDDPSGVELYWHNRFAKKRKEGEWFQLSPSDITAFKRWKKIY